MIVYILEFSPDRGYDTIATDILGVFSTKEKAEEALEAERNNVHRFNKDDYYINDYEIDKKG